MATSLSAKKRNRQSIVNRKVNRATRGKIKTGMSGLGLNLKEGKTVTPEQARKLISTIDRAAKRGIIHKNTAARKKSQVMKSLARAAKK